MPELGRRLSELGWMTDLWVAGSLATGDYVPGVSDLDLVAVADGPVDGSARTSSGPSIRNSIGALQRALTSGAFTSTLARSAT